jgi:hypothetical protein
MDLLATGAYTTLGDPKRHICFNCRENLHCNQKHQQQKE